MPAESLAQLCGILVQIEADTKALIARMNAINEQAARFSMPVGWESTPENFLAQIQPEEFYFEQKKEVNMK